MRIDQVTVTGFGPLSSTTLPLAPGLTVVAGGNESAKSSWHAATYAALCGIRRGRGQPAPKDSAFRSRHQPWDGGPWRVGAMLTLDDGRVIEMTQELDGRVDCHALEMPMGRDVSNSIMFDGTPDASVWLGLNRKAFEATACIRQNDLLEVRGAGDALSELLGRAAATGETDASTARALELLDAFQKEHVGLDRANSIRPWRRAIEAEDQARAAVEAAASSRAEFDRRAADVERAEQDAARLRRAFRAARAAKLREEAAALEARAARAEALSAELGPQRPAGAGDSQGLVSEVTAALTSWRNRPAVPEDGEDPDQLRGELEELPHAPTHDVSPAQAAATAHGKLEAARHSLARHDQRPEAEAPASDGPAPADPDDLRDLATRLEVLGPEPAPPSGTASPAASRPRWPWLVAAVGVVLLVVGAVIGQVWLDAVGVLVAVAGVALYLRSASAPRAAGTTVDPRPAWRESRAALEERARLLGVAAEPAALRAAAAEADAAERHASVHAEWVGRRRELEESVTMAEAELRGALAGRVAEDELTDVTAAYHSYLEACETAAAVAAQAALRPALESRLREATAVAQRRKDALEQAGSRESELRSVAARLGASVADDADGETLAGALAQWLESVREKANRAQEAEQGWTELDRLLGTGDLDALQQRAARAAAAAASAADGFTDAELDEVGSTDDAGLAVMEREASTAESQAAGERGALAEFAAALPDVSALEERLAVAEQERRRVEALKSVLEKTASFMSAAQDRVHRDIAPRLQASLLRWLPVVTQGRYTDATVDPQSLDVRVRGEGSPWRKGELLSYGTAEQIYLLLRLALVEHLTAGHDTCPLLCDDVTVHADSTRTRAILDLLLQVAEDRQVVLFTQEDMVVEWARERLAGRPGALVELTDLPSV